MGTEMSVCQLSEGCVSLAECFRFLSRCHRPSKPVVDGGIFFFFLLVTTTLLVRSIERLVVCIA